MSWNHRRRDLEELMDGPGCSDEEIRGALVFLRRVNGWSFARRLLDREMMGVCEAPAGRILDVATGGADLPAHLKRHGSVRLAVGLDKSGVILSHAQELSPGVTLVRADCFRMPFPDKAFDAVVCHLFFHHVDEREFVALLREMDRVAKSLVVLDLARSRWLYALVKVLVGLFGNRLTRYDGPVSVQRSYTAPEVRDLARRAGVAVTVKKLPLWRWSAVSHNSRQ